MKKLVYQSKIVRWVLFVLLVFALLTGSVFSYQSAQAAAELSITPITWDIIGLDSNDETTGPNHFPVGARVCNDGDTDATNVTSTFIWDSTNDDIYLRSGTLSTYTGVNEVAILAPNNCVDFYYEVEVDRADSARETARQYHITASATGLSTISTPTPRELYVEYLISQSRNATLDVKLDGVSIPAGGTMALVVGETYTIELVASTATQGYNQIESFINFSNTIFKINSVETNYSAKPTPGTDHEDPDWANKLYADGCSWDPDPNSPLYQSCLLTGKYGGDVTVKYDITIIGGVGNIETLSSLIYDFSGSSFHYNADYTAGARLAAIIDPASAYIDKIFTPSTTTPGGVSTLTFTLSNPNAAPLTNVSFTDTFPTSPGNMIVATPAVFSTSGCGTPTFAPAEGAGSISFTNGTIPANGICVVNVSVTVPAAGSYNNTSSNLFIGSVDTDDNASATLTASTTAPPACTPGLEMVTWRFDDLTTNRTWKSSKVSGVSQSYSGTGASAISTGVGNPVNSWGVTSGWAADNTGYPNNGGAPYFEFSTNSSNFSNVNITYQYKIDGNWANKADNHLYTYSLANGAATFTNIGDVSGFDKNDPFLTIGPTPAFATGSITTTFRMNGVGQQQPTAVLYVDNVVITGCGVPQPPTLTKAFSPDPIAVNGTSTLTFNLANENNVTLTDVRFTDVLPAGLEVAATPAASTTCGGTWAPTTGSTTLQFSNGTIPARVGTTNGSCTVSVSIKATTGGAHQNVSGFIYSTETYTNTTSTGSGTASLTAILPPEIYKSFNPDSILANGISRLTFRIVNPNPDNQLTGVQFTDTFPTSPGNMVVATPATYSTSGCGTPTFAPGAGDGSISFTNGTIVAGETCTIQVDVTAPTIGIYNNTTGVVSAAIVGNGNTASDSLDVTAPHPSVSVLKQISTSAAGPWTTFVGVPENTNVYYRFTVENTGDVPLTSVNVTDPVLRLVPPNADSVVPGCTWANMPLYDVQTCVYGAVITVSGWHYNTANSHGTYGGTVYNSDDSTASYATTGLTLDKSAYETAFTAAGDVLHYSYVVTNNGAAPLRGPVTIADDKSTNETCPPVKSIGDNDDWLDPGESITCVATYAVQSGDGSSVTNYATATVDGVNSNEDSVTVNQAAADFGDLPASYNVTLQGNDGPRHTTGNLTLGLTITTENDGQESDGANGDGDSDDGVIRDPNGRWTNNSTVDIFLDLKGTGGTAEVGMWLDWDRDGAFQADEFVSFTGLTTGNGTVYRNTVKVTVPDSADYTVSTAPLFVRVRVFDPASIPGGSLDSSDFVGLANGGEVEDYRWEFSAPNAVSLADFSAQASRTPALAALVGVLLLGAGIFLLLVRKQKAAQR